MTLRYEIIKFVYHRLQAQKQANITSHQSHNKNSRFRLLFVFFYRSVPYLHLFYRCSWKIDDEEMLSSRIKLSWFIMSGRIRHYYVHHRLYGLFINFILKKIKQKRENEWTKKNTAQKKKNYLTVRGRWQKIELDSSISSISSIHLSSVYPLDEVVGPSRRWRSEKNRERQQQSPNESITNE